jgi:hypothetical protein
MNEPSERTVKAVRLTVGVMLEARYAEVGVEWDPEWDDRIQVVGTVTEGTWCSPGTFGSDCGDWSRNPDGILTIRADAYGD